MPGNYARYQRIARFYDLIDLPFEQLRYRSLRPLLFYGLSGRVLDAGVGTGRNFPYYPPTAKIVGVDFSPRMLARAERRRALAAAPVELWQMDVTQLDFAADSFEAAVAAFLFCVLPEEAQVPALRELARVVKPGGPIRLLDYVRPAGGVRRVLSRVWQPWAAWAYGADFDRDTERHLGAAGLAVEEVRFVVPDLLRLLYTRAPSRPR